MAGENTSAKQNSNITSRSHHDIAHLHLPSNVYHLSASSRNILPFPRYSPEEILKLKVPTARPKIKSRSHNGISSVHPNQSSCHVSTFYTLQFPRYSWDKIIVQAQLPTHPTAQLVTMGENNTNTAFKGYRVYDSLNVLQWVVNIYMLKDTVVL